MKRPRTQYPRHTNDPVDRALTAFCGRPYEHARLLSLWDRLGFPREKLGRGNNGNQRMTPASFCAA
jgi:hypothetical protein